MVMSSAVGIDAMLRTRWEIILLSIEKAYAVRFFDLEPSVRQIVWSGYSSISSFMCETWVDLLGEAI